MTLDVVAGSGSIKVEDIAIVSGPAKFNSNRG
jgi:hypothetical protein